MKSPFVAIGCLALLLLPVARPCLGANGPTALDIRGLGILRQLGLPDTRGAKWVRVTGNGWGWESGWLPGLSGETSGNAWLVHEAANGTVELIVGQTRRLRTQRTQGRLEQVFLPSGTMPSEVRIEPADLRQDLALLEHGLRELREAGAKDDEQDINRAAHRLDNSSSTLLFLAHLQRQGRSAEVQALLPLLQEAGGLPKATVDVAISHLAEARLEEVNRQWVENGNAVAYARNLEALAARFPRGWRSRGAVLLLAERARAQMAAGKTRRSPAAEEALRILLTLRPEHLVELPVDANWLLPGAEGGSLANVGMGTIGCGGPPTQYNALTWRELEEMAGSLAPAMPPSFQPMRTFLLRRLPSAAALAELMKDRRLLRVLKRGSSAEWLPTDPLVRKTSSEEGAALYERIPRPFEVRELVWELLRGLPPRAAPWDSLADDEKPKAVAWLNSLEGLDEEGVLLAYLHAGVLSNQVLSAALEHPTPEKLEVVRREFLAGSWQGDFELEERLEPLRKFVLVLGPASGAFAEELMASLRAKPPTSANPGAVGEETSPSREVNLKEEELQKVERVLHPRELKTLLAEFGSATRDEAEKLQPAMVATLGLRFDENTEALILQAAADATSADGKRALLMYLAEDQGLYLMPKRHGREMAHPQSRAALARLLRDQTVLSRYEFADGGWLSEATVAGYTANEVVMTRMGNRQQAFRELEERAPALAAEWAHAVAEALAAHRAEPPLPSVSDEKPKH